MSRFRFLKAVLTALPLVLPALSEAQAEEPRQVRVLSYNIHHGEGVDGVLDLERIAAVIRSVAPDIVALQEVDRGTRRAGGVDQPAELGRLTGLTPLFERNIPFQGGDYGNALLTRRPVKEHRNVALPALTEGERRGVLVVDLEPPAEDGRGTAPLRVFATHLDHRADDAERMASAALINEIANEHPEIPSILMGDLNALPESRVLTLFDACWVRANDRPLPTFPVEAPTRQIDYILVRPAARWKVVEARVLEEPVASDHRPIFAVLERVGEE